MAVTQKQIDKLVIQLTDIREEAENLRDDKEDTLCKAQDAAHPNEERIEKLETQFNTLEEVCYQLDDMISNLEGYDV